MRRERRRRHRARSEGFDEHSVQNAAQPSSGHAGAEQQGDQEAESEAQHGRVIGRLASGLNAKAGASGARWSRLRRLLVGRKRDFALLLEAGAAATAGDAVLRLARSASDFAAARTHPVDCADHQLARAHAGYSCVGQASPPVTTDTPQPTLAPA